MENGERPSGTEDWQDPMDVEEVGPCGLHWRASVRGRSVYVYEHASNGL
jgi:hypothetical protein